MVTNFINDSLTAMEKQNEQHINYLDEYILENTPQRIRQRYHKVCDYAASHSFGVLDEDVVVIDTETTGFSFNHDELIQIAAARMKQGEIIEWYITFVNPGKSIPEDIAHLTHITDDDVADAPEPDEALADLVKFVGSSDVVAHNVGFDRTFVTKREAGEPLKQNRWIDSLDLARIALPRLTSHRLLDLARAFGVPESTHRADDDVAATCVVYRILLAAITLMPEDLVASIACMSDVESWNTAYVFQCLANPVAREKADQRPYKMVRARKESLTKDLHPLRPDANSPLSEVSLSEVEACRNGDNNKDDREAACQRSYEVAAACVEDKLDEGIYNQTSNGSGDEGIKMQGACGSAPAEFAPRILTFADKETIIEAFSPGGLLDRLYQNYEVREEQKEMALAVHTALSQSRNVAVEAGTGVGKSMAYLIPLALAAKENKITVGVATKTNALLDQLVNKELPLLADSLDITYAPLKGFSHYPCLRKVDYLIKQGASVIQFKKQPISQAPSLAGLLSFIEQTDYDDMDALKIDYRAIPRWNITTTSAECLRRKCPFFGRLCFVHGAREQAQRCDVVVTNHSLLFWDVRYEGELLPPIRYWVVDEAHGAEAEARRAFSMTLSSEELHSLSNRVTSDSASSNVLTRVQRSAQAPEEGQALYDALISKARVCAEAFRIAVEEFCLSVKDLLVFDQKSRSRGYEWFDLWLNTDIRQGQTYQGVRSCAKALYGTLEKVIKATRDIVAYAEQMDDTSSAQRELAVVALQLREVYDTLDTMFFRENDNSVYSVRLHRSKTTFDDVFTVQPLDMGTALNESLYPNTRSIIYTSATLAIDGRFTDFERAVGLNESEESQADTLLVESSYDFDTNMQIYVPTDMPEPQDTAYLAALQDFLIKIHRVQEGSLLTLFTNRKEMERCFDVVQPALKENDLRLVCQKWGVSVKGLKDDFLKDEHLSLFALKSFWEGFDAPGSTLKGVIIPKLPFGLPTDPLSCERQQRDDHAWAHYSLPAAVIDIKQAVGRLIRTAYDKGIVVLADKRLITKYYGNKFLNSLPSRSVLFLTCEEIVRDVHDRMQTEYACDQRADDAE